jgi:hypothetical protein
MIGREGSDLIFSSFLKDVDDAVATRRAQNALFRQQNIEQAARQSELEEEARRVRLAELAERAHAFFEVVVPLVAKACQIAEIPVDLNTTLYGASRSVWVVRGGAIRTGYYSDNGGWGKESSIDYSKPRYTWSGHVLSTAGELLSCVSESGSEQPVTGSTRSVSLVEPARLTLDSELQSIRDEMRNFVVVRRLQPYLHNLSNWTIARTAD